MDLFLTNTLLFSSDDVNWCTGVVWITCGLLWCFINCFDSFWRHPFTAEDPLVSKWWNDFSKSDEETNSSTLNDLRVSTFSVDFHFWMNLSQNNTQAVHSDIKHSSEKSYSMLEKYNLLWREPRIQIWADTAVLISPNFRCIFPSGRIASQCVWFRLKSSGYLLHAEYRFPPTEDGVCACGRRVKELLSLLMSNSLIACFSRVGI